MTADVLRLRLVHYRISGQITRDTYDALVAQLDVGRPVGEVARTLAAHSGLPVLAASGCASP